MSNVNIHEYPEDLTKLLEYMAAVTQAYCTDGMALEAKPRGYSNDWFPVSLPAMLNWHDYKYRIAAPKIAKGHNRAQLTEDQVGVKDGWRLLEEAEIGERDLTYNIEAWLQSAMRWDSRGWAGAAEDRTYRTKKPEGYFLPKPEVPLADLDSSSFDAALVQYEITADSTLSGAFSCGWNAALKYERSRAK